MSSFLGSIATIGSLTCSSPNGSALAIDIGIMRPHRGFNEASQTYQTDKKITVSSDDNQDLRRSD